MVNDRYQVGGMLKSRKDGTLYEIKEKIVGGVILKNEENKNEFPIGFSVIDFYYELTKSI